MRKIAPVYITKNHNKSMFKKIIKKLKSGSCKTAKTDDVDSFKEHQKKNEKSMK